MAEDNNLRTCPYCNGRGKLFSSLAWDGFYPCNTCNGSGSVSVEFISEYMESPNYLPKRIKDIEKQLAAQAVGLQNVYDEVKKYIDIARKFQIERDKLEILNKRKSVEEYEIIISPYPMNTKISLLIKTNFGSIKYAYDFPPQSQNCIGDYLQNSIDTLLDELYKVHEERGGKYIGEVGAKDWFDNNEPTVIDKGYCKSPRVHDDSKPE